MDEKETSVMYSNSCKEVIDQLAFISDREEYTALLLCFRLRPVELVSWRY